MKRINTAVLNGRPAAFANIKGSSDYPDIRGTAKFFSVCGGTAAVIELFGLPNSGFFALHIHEHGDCSGNEQDKFANVGPHFDLNKDPHPFHNGDLPAVLSNDGYAWYAVFTERFKPCQIKGRSVIVHLNPDDYHTQPSGGAGVKIACGPILSNERGCNNCL